MKGSVYIATTVDGFIADIDGGVGFLDDYNQCAEGDMGFAEFMASIDVIVMGRRSFEKVLSFGLNMWAYGTTPVVVWSRNKVEIPDKLADTVTCSSKSPQNLFAQLEQEQKTHAYVDGGFTVQSFTDAGLIDQFIITRVPLLLGKGIPLFGGGESAAKTRLQHVKTESFSNGLVQSKYVVIRNE